MSREPQKWDLFIAHAGPDGPLAERLYALVAPRTHAFLDSR